MTTTKTEALEEMTVDELKTLAAEKGVELTSGMKKAEIIDAISAHVKKAEIIDATKKTLYPTSSTTEAKLSVDEIRHLKILT